MAARFASMRAAALALLRSLASARLASLLRPVAAVLFAGLAFASACADAAIAFVPPDVAPDVAPRAACVEVNCALAIMLAKRLLAASSIFCGAVAAANSLLLKLFFESAGLLFRVFIMVRRAFDLIFSERLNERLNERFSVMFVERTQAYFAASSA